MHQPGSDRVAGRKSRDGHGSAEYPKTRASNRSVRAAIDVGSNSVHMLVARVDDDATELWDRSTYFGLGPIVDRSGAVGAYRDRLVTTIGDYVSRARNLGATEVKVVGTEPLRRAADAGLVSAELERRIGVTLEVLSHEEEGFLMTVGARAGRRVTRRQLLVDVGGGSTDCVLLEPGRSPRAWGVGLGTARLTSGHVRRDPPRAQEIASLRIAARSALDGRPEFDALDSVDSVDSVDLVAVGGTARSLVKVAGGAALDRMLSLDRLGRVMADLEGETSERFATRRRIKAWRARLLPAGVAILEAMLERAHRPVLQVSRAGLREGLAIASVRAGSSWREALPELAGGWRD